MAKGDVIKVWMRNAETMEVTAQQNGRSVDSSISKDSGISWLAITELTRGGTVVREMKVALTDVVAYLKVARE